MGQNFSSEPVVEKETERGHNDIFNVAVSSCQGWRMSQEDNHSLILDLPGEHKAAFFAVFDGHGSARVSKHASEGLWRHLVENEAYIKGNFKEALEASFLTFDRDVNESCNAQLAGTTAVSLLIVDNSIYCANIGDSRGVACVNCECIPLSYDHKPENPLELKRILDAGGYVLGNRVNGNLALSRAFGDFHYKNNENLPPEQQIVSPYPDVKSIDLNDDVDFLLLACDGIWDVLSSEEVVEFVISRLEQNMEPGLICEQLTTRCLATDYELVIGCDNMTVLLVCYTRGRSWADFCTDIFNKNTRKLGEPGRIKPLYDPSSSSTNEVAEVDASSDVRTPNKVFYDLLDVWKTQGGADPTTAKDSSSGATQEEREEQSEEKTAPADCSENRSEKDENEASLTKETTEGEAAKVTTTTCNQKDDAQAHPIEVEEGKEVSREKGQKEPEVCSIKALLNNEEVGIEKSCPIKEETCSVKDEAAVEVKEGDEKPKSEQEKEEDIKVDRSQEEEVIKTPEEISAAAQANDDVDGEKEEVEGISGGQSVQCESENQKETTEESTHSSSSTSSNESGVES